MKKKTKKQQTDDPIVSQKNASFHRYFYVIWKLIEWNSSGLMLKQSPSNRIIIVWHENTRA